MSAKNGQRKNQKGIVNFPFYLIPSQSVETRVNLELRSHPAAFIMGCWLSILF